MTSIEGHSRAHDAIRRALVPAAISFPIIVLTIVGALCIGG